METPTQYIEDLGSATMLIGMVAEEVLVTTAYGDCILSL